MGEFDEGGTSALTVESTYFGENEAAQSGGAIYALFLHTVSATDSIFQSNVAFDVNGGAIYNPSQIERCEFLENRAQYGGAIFIRSVASVAHSFFWSNTATYLGGGLVINDSTEVDSFVDVVNNTFVDNLVVTGDGAAIYIYDADRVTLRNNIVADFRSTDTCIHNVEIIGELSFDHNNVYSVEGVTWAGLNTYPGLICLLYTSPSPRD